MGYGVLLTTTSVVGGHVSLVRPSTRIKQLTFHAQSVNSQQQGLVDEQQELLKVVVNAPTPTSTRLVREREVMTLMSNVGDNGGDDAWSLVVAGFAFGIAMAVLGFLLSLEKRRIADEATPSLAAVDKDRVLKIRNMAKQASLEQEHTDAEVLNAKKITLPRTDDKAEILARQLEAVRSMPQILEGAEEVSSTNGSSTEKVISSDLVTEEFPKSNKSVPKRIKPRIITSYAEATEFLSNKRERTSNAKPTAEKKNIMQDSIERKNNMQDSLEEKNNMKVSQPQMSSSDVEAKQNRTTITAATQKGLLKNQTPESNQSTETTSQPKKKNSFKIERPKVNVKKDLIRAQQTKKKSMSKHKGYNSITETATGGAKHNNISSEDLPIFTPSKQWSKDLHLRYARETPENRELMRRMGKDLNKWMTEEEFSVFKDLYERGPDAWPEFTRRFLAYVKEDVGMDDDDGDNGDDGDDGDDDDDDDDGGREDLKKRYEVSNERIERWTRMYGPNALVNKYRDYKPSKPNQYWWLSLPHVVCIALENREKGIEVGLYALDMSEENSAEITHAIAFQDQSDAKNFCQTLVRELDTLGGTTAASLVPFQPRDLYKEAKELGYEVTVIKKGEVELYAGQSLVDVEERIVEIGQQYYEQLELHKTGYDINAIVDDIGRLT